MPDFSEAAPIVDVPCPICADDGVRRRVADTVWGAPEAIVCQCSACKTVFLDQVMTEDEEEEFYAAQWAHYMRERGGPGETQPEAHFEANVPEAQRRMGHLLPLLRPDMRVLELGSSTGFLLDAVRPHVDSVIGVEPGKLYADYANQRLIPTVSMLTDVKGELFDLILAYYVVEHLRKPVEQLRIFRDLLKPGGVFAIEVPNVDDTLVTFYALDAFDRFYWQIAHPFNYSVGTLLRVLDEAGFTNIEMIPDQRYDISNHIHWMVTGKPGGKGKYTHVFDEAANREYVRCLKEHWLCDTIFAIARAPNS